MGDGFTLARTLFTGAEVNVPKTSDAKPSAQKDSSANTGAGKALSAAGKLLTLQDDKPSTLKAKQLLKPLDHRIACFVTSKITITEIKKAAKAKGFTINDMVLAALSASLRKYQLQKGGEVVDPLAAVWVALKPLAEAFTKQDADKVDEPGNTTLGAVYVRLPVAKEFDDRSQRVQAIYDEISKLKGSPEPLMAQGTMVYSVSYRRNSRILFGTRSPIKSRCPYPTCQVHLIQISLGVAHDPLASLFSFLQSGLFLHSV
jgi:hypothetical protein